jgi:uncharacterized metal-binding protein YceD (DUF177 family)
VTQKAYVVPLRDLEDGPKTLRGVVSDAWLTQQLADTDATPAGKDDGTLDVTLTKNGRDVLVRGRLTATIQVPCARTLDPAVYRVSPEVFLLLGPKAGASPAEGAGQRAGRAREAAREGRAAARKAGGWEEDGLLDSEDAARDTYTGDQIVLDEFLREFILLEIPMVPLREDLRKAPFEATPSPPGSPSAGESKPEELDPRLSPLIALKARLEQKE